MSKPPRQSQAASFKHAFEGMARAFRSELHMKVHALFAVAALATCAVLRVDSTGWCLVLLCVGAVIAAELFNTALEALADKACPEHDPLVKAAKDAAAAAVLLLAVVSVAVGLVVFVPALLELIG